MPTLKRDIKYFKNGREWLKFFFAQSTNVTNKLTAKQALFLQIYCNYKNDMHKDQNPALASTKDSQLVTYLEWSYSKRRELTQRWPRPRSDSFACHFVNFPRTSTSEFEFPAKIIFTIISKIINSTVTIYL